jgi:hypothetical protein
VIGEDPADRHKRIMRKSKKQERRSASAYGGSVQPRSGAGWYKKNDVRTSHFLIENKLTENLKSYTVKFTDLRDLAKNALQEDRIPVLQFDLGGKHFVILNEDDFQMMVADDGE